jgi:hypothetical protein
VSEVPDLVASDHFVPLIRPDNRKRRIVAGEDAI